MICQIPTHTPLAGRDIVCCPQAQSGRISTHTPLAGRDICDVCVRCNNHISTHTPLAGRDARLRTSKTSSFDFNSHAPRGARLVVISALIFSFGISTHTPLAGRDDFCVCSRVMICISTHTPLAGRDSRCCSTPCAALFHFNSHAPRGARQVAGLGEWGVEDFNSHAPRGARHERLSCSHIAVQISTHTPLAGRDV